MAKQILVNCYLKKSKFIYLFTWYVILMQFTLSNKMQCILQ